MLQQLELSERDQARFWSKVALPGEDGCMLWLAHTVGNGYGRFYLAGRMVLAHRVSYVLANGPVPEGLQVDHVKAKGCTNRHCVAPEHLEAVTPLENSRRSTSGARMRAKAHCPQGHPYDEANTYRDRRGRRHCRRCRTARTRAWYLRRRGLPNAPAA